MTDPLDRIATVAEEFLKLAEKEISKEENENVSIDDYKKIKSELQQLKGKYENLWNKHQELLRENK